MPTSQGSYGIVQLGQCANQSRQLGYGTVGAVCQPVKAVTVLYVQLGQCVNQSRQLGYGTVGAVCLHGSGLSYLVKEII